ncbi:hypothetical protein NQ314_005610 [Rhamnusium bicolor]|uniref:Uncharacterized protein n=1 Tax=Rhamnusium bicolor TaxID=1586634 RepID=A0AAV8ZI07_9CUCU|nr:hypothetical protein NQ314_005610 [Rhamnusium bicolor]
MHIKVDAQLRELVFGRMQADRVSLVAQHDTLICAFGARACQGVNRDKKTEPSIKNMLAALNPKYFDLFVTATKILAKFNPHTEKFESPTFAMNIATSLKQCCDIAINLALKKVCILKVKTLKAGNDLNSKTWNRVTIIPLATDLKMLKNYLNKRAEEAACNLIKENFDKSAYNTLLETIYCRLILLNRKRPGELQRMKYHVYNDNINQNAETYQEFDTVISTTEKILLHKFKRIVIRGKRGRGVPVLVSQDVQQHVEIMNQHRLNFVHVNNPYLFAMPNNQIQSVIYGYKVLQKYAKQSEKHLATLTQIFNMKEEELEQLAKFMGHTLSVHKNSYRLPDDVYQTAKVSKILMLMENGKAADFKGKSLDEIEIDLEEDLLNSNLYETDVADKDLSEYEDDNFEDDNETRSNSLIANRSNKNLDNKIFVKYEPKRKVRTLIPWTAEQKQIVTEFFTEHIKISKPPKRNECEELIEKHPELANKNWMKIKVFVQNVRQSLEALSSLLIQNSNSLAQDSNAKPIEITKDAS